MESRYYWNDVSVQMLRDQTQAAHDAVVAARDMVTVLTAQMQSDTTWSGQNKLAFVAWMDLVRQLHEKVADDSIGPAAVHSLDDFLTHLAGFYHTSAASATLGGVE